MTREERFSQKQMDKKKIGMVVIATNKYTQFIPPLMKSAQRFFMPGHDVRMFVFTDGTVPPHPMITRIEQEHMPWPHTTLQRYNIFHKHREQLSEMDYLFYSDADMRFVATVGDEILPDTDTGLVGTEHPGFYGGRQGTYETNPLSMAYVVPGKAKTYYAGGFNGGTSQAFLKMAEYIAGNVTTDLNNDIIAIWHDESHMNRYFIDHPPKTLSPSYCYPESWNIPFEKKLLALDKNHGDIRK